MAVVIVFELEATRLGPASRLSDSNVRAAVIGAVAERKRVEMAIAGEVLSVLAVLDGFINSAQQVFFDVFHAQKLFTTFRPVVPMD